MLHASPSDRYANALRGVVFAIWLLKFAFDPLQLLAELPVGFFVPPFPLSLLPEEWFGPLLSHGSLLALRLVGFSACLFCLWRRFVPSAGFVACFVILLYQCLLRGYGHINHAEIVALLAVFIYWLFSLAKTRNTNPEPVAIAFVLCFSYSLVAAHRFSFGGIEVFTSDTILYWAANNSSLVCYFDFGLGKLTMQNEWLGWVLKGAFAWVSFFEFVAPLALIIPRLRLPFFVSIVGFHIGALLAMNILFWENMVLLVALFTPFLFEGSMSARLEDLLGAERCRDCLSMP